MGHAKIMSHLVSNGGGKAYQVVMVILQEKCTTAASDISEYIKEYQSTLFIFSSLRSYQLVDDT